MLTLDRQAALAGDPQVLRTMLQVGGDTYDVLRGAVTNLRRAAEAVILTADDFRSTDQQARDDFAQMDAALRNRPAPAAGPALPALGDPEHPGSVGTPSTPVPQAPAPERADRLHAGEDPADHWGQ
ncbi:hypothetical protein G5V59_03810 [Nocardioides sp. W3-2-3]|uniref:hypothetical protein n=1 Tax=Nocardioides convexus TaxID=2712224 RepID=UPI0024183FD2|nr:hypothetical protein [Nocardioides convexus]NGZ99763.1 hypothetical protein [Nocardioides convexus]